MTILFSKILIFLFAVHNKSKPPVIDTVEKTIQNVFDEYPLNQAIDEIPLTNRESVAIARKLSSRINNLKKNKDCPTCWFQKKHCICSECPPLISSNFPMKRLFVFMHHKEIGLAVDTAKLLLSCIPDAQLVINGILPKYQSSLEEMLSICEKESDETLVLFPDETAQTFESINDLNIPNKWNVIVLDGTWSQANRMHSYIPSHIQRIQLHPSSLDELGYQIRRHPIAWKQISTLEATRILIGNMIDVYHSDEQMVMEYKRNWCDSLSLYQTILNDAARKQLGPPRLK